jgi:predicted DNA-binding transcriptional regulator YafY
MRMAAFPPESEAQMALNDENGSITARPMRLASIYLMLTDGFALTASALSEATGAGRRTIYRDIERLRSSGLEIEGTPHAGYTLGKAPELTPLFLTRAERTALVAIATGGLRMKLREL